GGGSQRSQRQGILLPLFPNPKGKRGPTSYPGLTGSQQIYGKVEIPYALPGHYYPLYGSGRLVRRPRHEGRVFPYCHLPTSQTLPALRSGPETLPVHGPAIRPLNSTEGLYEVYGSGSSRPSASKSSGIPLPRRLAYPWQLHQPGPVSHSQGHGHVQASGPPTECRKVHFGANTENRLYRGNTGLYSRQGVPPRGSFSNACSRHTQPPSLPNLNSPLLPQPHGSYGIMHLRDSSRQVTPTAPPGMAGLRIPATQGQPRYDSNGPTASPSLPQLVAGPRACDVRCPISSTSTFPCLDYGCIIPRLGGSPAEPPNAGPVVRTGADTTHQCQRTPSGMSCLPSLRSTLTGPLCLHPYRQHDGHALHQQTGRGTLPPPLPRGNSALGLLHSPLHSPGSLVSPRSPEHLGGPPEQVLSNSRVVHSTGRHPLCLPEVGVSPDRSLRDSREQEMPRVLLIPGSLPRLPDRRFSPSLDGPPGLCLPASSTGPQSPAQTTQGQGPSNPDCPSV
ncbi:hypothetical protein G0U57_007779, partial [Chelydra serpentina]